MTTKKKTNPILTMKTETNNWYAMEIAKDSEGNATSSAEISIYDEIGGWGVTANDFIASLESLGEVSNIDLRISSPGGSIIEGNVIYNAIKRHPANVTVYIDGMAASMASVIAMAGDEIVMAENALLMIHNPWTVSIGDSEQLRKDADLMDKMKRRSSMRILAAATMPRN
jgi:ATP-dependent protease ClpP protease subunit